MNTLYFFLSLIRLLMVNRSLVPRSDVLSCCRTCCCVFLSLKGMNDCIMIFHTSTLFQLNWMKGKDTRGYPYRGYPPRARPNHSTGNSVPNLFRTVLELFYVSHNCEQLRVVTRDLRFIVIIREDWPFANVITQAALSTRLFKDPECWHGHNLNSRTAVRHWTNWAHRLAVSS